MRFTLLAFGAVMIFVGAPAEAKPLPDFIKDNLGDWLVVTDDGKAGCRIALLGETGKIGWHAMPGADCATRSPTVSQAVAWNFDGGVQLLGADGQTLLDFQEDETTLMKTSFERSPVFYIVRAKAGVDRAPFAPALVGDWSLRSRKGSAKCSVTISRKPDDDSELVLKTGSSCDAGIARMKITTARVEDFSLVLYGARDTSLSMEPSGPNSYATTEGKAFEMERIQ